MTTSMLEHSVHLAFGDDRPEGLSTAVSEGHPANVPVEASAGAQLLVMGSRGHSGFAGLAIGAASAHCAEHARGSVLVTHDAPDVSTASDATDVH